MELQSVIKIVCSMIIILQVVMAACVCVWERLFVRVIKLNINDSFVRITKIRVHKLSQSLTCPIMKRLSDF